MGIVSFKESVKPISGMQDKRLCTCIGKCLKKQLKIKTAFKKMQHQLEFE